MVNSSFVELNSPAFNATRSVADLVRFRITRAHIASGHVGPLVDQLMQLSDNLDGLNNWKSKLFIGIEKSPDDTRDASETAATVQYFRQLTREWPFWLHFAEKEWGTMASVLRLLIGTERQYLPDGSAHRVLTDADEVRSMSKCLYGTTKLLYRFHQLPESDDFAMAKELTRVVNTMFHKS